MRSWRDILKCGLFGLLIIGLWIGCFWMSGCRKNRSGKRPNIFLITIDTLRTDHLGCYGYSKNTSPNIDQFAQDAMLFENCLSHAPETRFSFASILTGFFPHETQIQKNQPFTSEVETIAERLQVVGYKTIAVISNYVLRGGEGWDQGFMIYDDTMMDRELVRQWPERIAEHTTDRAIELLKQFYQDPLFVWIHYQDPHGPYTPPMPFNNMFKDYDQNQHNIRLNSSLSGRGGIPSYQRLGENTNFYYYVSQYDGEIRYMDEYFKHLIDALKEFGLYEDALIILSSDHGEGMGEHNYYFAHGENLYNNLTHVPLIIRYGKDLVGRRTDYVQHIDIVPTILNILDMEVDSRFRGFDLLKTQETKREIFAEMNSPLVADGVKLSLVVDDLKLIYTPLNDRFELFNLKKDFYENNNVINDPGHKKQVNDLKTRLKQMSTDDFLGLSIVDKHRTLSEEEKEKLKSLGYIQ